MKKLIACFLIFFATAVPASAESPRALEAQLYVTQCKLKNFQTALSMWQVDHDGRYPEKLSQLSPNYLRVIPEGPSGSVQDWNYQRNSDGKSFRFTLKGQSVIPNTSFDEENPLQVGPLTPPPQGRLHLSLPQSQRENWKLNGQVYSHNTCHQFIGSRLCGPSRTDQSGEEWLLESVKSFKSWANRKTMKEQPVKVGDLKGIEIVARGEHFTSHKFFLTDGMLGWEISYDAANSEFSPQTQEMFLSMVRNHSRP